MVRLHDNTPATTGPCKVSIPGISRNEGTSDQGRIMIDPFGTSMLPVPAINGRQPQEDIQVSVIWIAWMAETDMGMASPNRLQRANT